MRRSVMWCAAPLLVLGCGGGASAVIPTPGPLVTAAGPARSELVVVRSGNPSSIDIIAMDADGRHRRALVGSSRRPKVHVVSGRPAWSPDGRWLAFAADVGHRIRPRDYPLTDIFVVRANGSGLRRLTHTGSARSPTWSPDARTIIFAALTVFSGDPNIFTSVATSLWRMNADGTNSRPVTPVVHGQIDIPGSFSPGGTRLAFTRIKPGTIGPGLRSDNGEIDVARSDGSDLQTVATDAADPAFSPDGRKVAFVSDRDRNGTVRTGEDESAYANELYVMDPDGHNMRRLTYTGELSEFAPAWSPDGTRIAYARQDSGFTKIVAVVNADGSCSKEIATDPSGSTWYSEPAWRPGRARSGEGSLRCRR